MLGELTKIIGGIGVVTHAVITLSAPKIRAVASHCIVVAHANAVVKVLDSPVHVSIDKLLCSQLKENHLFCFKDTATGLADSVYRV